MNVLNFTGGLLWLLTNLVLVPLATIGIFEGIRRFSWRPVVWNPVANLIFGAVVLGGCASYSLWAASTIESILAFMVLDQKPLPILSDDRLAQMTPQEREYKTRLLARLAFDRNGSLATYISASGQPTRYAPSEEEIRDREQREELFVRIRTMQGFFRGQAWTLMMAGVVAVAAGVYARFHARGKREGLTG